MEVDLLEQYWRHTIECLLNDTCVPNLVLATITDLKINKHGGSIVFCQAIAATMAYDMPCSVVGWELSSSNSVCAIPRACQILQSQYVIFNIEYRFGKGFIKSLSIAFNQPVTRGILSLLAASAMNDTHREGCKGGHWLLVTFVRWTSSTKRRKALDYLWMRLVQVSEKVDNEPSDWSTPAILNI